MEFDTKHNLGFLVNPKRFNVAITRAQALLIIVGNPAVLSVDPHWGQLLNVALENGAYRGCEVSDELRQRIATGGGLGLGGGAGANSSSSEGLSDDVLEAMEALGLEDPAEVAAAAARAAAAVEELEADAAAVEAAMGLAEQGDGEEELLMTSMAQTQEGPAWRAEE